MGEIRRGLPGLLLFLGFLFAPVAQGAQKPAARIPASGIIQFKNASPGAAYVGSKTCSECHTDLYASYLKTDMGRSMSLPGERNEFNELAAPVRVKHPKANRYYEVYRRGPDLYQCEYELDAEGREVFRDEQKIDYVVGSGANGFTCIVQRGDYLFEAPLSYYSRPRAWALSPGYEQSDYSFSRPIQADCISCHSGRPQPVEASEGKFRTPPFKEFSIGCESCHGPGAIHVKERREGAPLEGPVDRSIVNPAKLPPWLANNICMYCHQAMDAAVLMPGKRYADFRPGTPLTDTLAIFAVPFRRDAPPKEPLLQHYVLMSLSQCYLKSGEKLSCITCHDPHRQPTPSETPEYFRSKCLSCHTEQSCKLSLVARRAKTPPDDCAGCHMPKQALQGISHSSLTEHRILARAGESLPESAFHLTSLSLPDLVHLNAIPAAAANGGSAGPASVPPLALFRAYGELMSAHDEYRPRFDATLIQLANANSQDSLVLSTLARNLMSEGTTESEAKAEEYFKRAIVAGSTSAQDVELLATLQAKSGRTNDAIATVQRGLAANPYAVLLYRDLALLYLAARDSENAVRTMKKALELFPEDSFTRALLQKTLTETQ